MTLQYRIEPRQSQFTVHATASGMLSFLGHNPTFAVRDYAGKIRFESSEVRTMMLDLTVSADSLDLIDQVKSADRKEIHERMRRDVLETSKYSEITFDSTDVIADAIAPGRYNLQIRGQLNLHGVTRAQQVRGVLQVFTDGLRLQGDGSLRLSDYRIAPVSALGGSIKLDDTLKLAFDLIALPEGP